MTAKQTSLQRVCVDFWGILRCPINQAEEMQLLPALAGRSQTRHWRIGDRSIPWQVASQQSLPPFPPAKSFQPNTAANATIGHRSMPKQIHRRLRADRPFVSSERSRQPESPHSGVAHLAPEYWPTF